MCKKNRIARKESIWTSGATKRSAVVAAVGGVSRRAVEKPAIKSAASSYGRQRSDVAAVSQRNIVNSLISFYCAIVGLAMIDNDV